MIEYNRKQICKIIGQRLKDKGLNVHPKVITFIVQMFEFFLSKHITKDKYSLRLPTRNNPVLFIAPDWREKIRKNEIAYKEKK